MNRTKLGFFFGSHYLFGCFRYFRERFLFGTACSFCKYQLFAIIIVLVAVVVIICYITVYAYTHPRKYLLLFSFAPFIFTAVCASASLQRLLFFSTLPLFSLKFQAQLIQHCTIASFASRLQKHSRMMNFKGILLVLFFFLL